MPSMDALPCGVQASVTDISLRVSVPVLSVQMKVVEPSVSTDSRRRTSAPRAAILWAPIARDRLTVGSRPSGTRARARHVERKEERVREANPDERRDDQEHDTHRKCDRGHDAHDAIQLDRERALRAPSRGRQLRDLGQPRRAAGRGDRADGFALDDVRPGKHRLALLWGRWNAFTGQHRRIDGQAVDVAHTQVRRDTVSRIQHHHVVGHELDRLDAIAPAVTDHGDAPWQQLTKPLAGFLGAVLLNEGKQAVEEDDDEDREPELRHTGKNRQPARDPEHDSEEVNELREQSPPQRQARRARQEIQAVLFPSLPDILEAQSRR